MLESSGRIFEKSLIVPYRASCVPFDRVKKGDLVHIFAKSRLDRRFQSKEVFLVLKDPAIGSTESLLTTMIVNQNELEIEVSDASVEVEVICPCRADSE